MKLIVYGLGQLFERYKNMIPMKSVEAFVDKNAEDGGELFGIPIIKPNNIKGYQFDYIVVFSDKFFKQIVRELHHEYYIPKEKIVSWRAITNNSALKPDEIKTYLLQHIKAFRDKTILEFGLDMMYGIISPANGLLKNEFSIDGIGKASYPYETAFYNHVWGDWMQLSGEYDLAVIKPGMLTDSLAKGMVKNNISHIILIEQYDFNRLHQIDNLLNKYCPKAKRTLLTSMVIIEITNEKSEDIDCVDYVITHKRYLIEEDGLYKGLSVGSNRIDGLLSELDGESVSEYNDRINETSGLYWIWKNTSSEYTGLSHYRRFFYNNAFQYEINRLDKTRIKSILCDMGYDIILSELKELDWPIYENINKTVGPELNGIAYQLFMEAIQEKQPEYVAAFENVMGGNKMHICNMFVTSRKIMDEYCSWLFSFYLDVVEKIDVSQGTAYQKRVAGYYSEVFWTVWIYMQKYKVFELPLTNVYSEN